MSNLPAELEHVCTCAHSDLIHRDLVVPSDHPPRSCMACACLAFEMSSAQSAWLQEMP